MADDRYTALTSALRRSTGTQSGVINNRTFRNTVFEIPNNMVPYTFNLRSQSFTIN